MQLALAFIMLLGLVVFYVELARDAAKALTRKPGGEPAPTAPADP